MLDDYEVSAEVAGEVKTKYGKAYRVKVLVPEHGFYINGMMVYPPNIDHPEWGVMPPGMPRQPGKFVVEFDKNQNNSLWLQVEEKCLEVAQIEHSTTKDEVITDIPDEPITLKDIPDF
jgi:hypothetical protein